MSFVLGLTGQTGAGKSTVSETLRQEGIAVIDADLVARQVVLPGTPALVRLRETFGEEIIREGALDRKKLGGIVFADPERLRTLNEIMLPVICEEIKRQMAQLFSQGRDVVVLDAPTLFESGADQMCQEICAVIAPEEDRCRRIMARDGLSYEQAMDRIYSQPGDDFFYEHCHIIIENSGSLQELYKSAEKLAQMLKLKGRLCQDESNRSLNDQRSSGL